MGTEREILAREAATAVGVRSRRKVQFKLRVDHATSAAEREADEIAGLALQALGPAPAGMWAASSGRVQRLADQPTVVGPEGGELDGATDARVRRAPSGKPMPLPLSSAMGSAFGADFSHVRVTTDSDLAPTLGARAYTYGNEIHFAPGEYQPSSTEGREVLAHELAHTVQQGVSPATSGGDAEPATRIRPMRRPLVQALFKSMRTNLVQASGKRATNTAYTQILTLLSQGTMLQNSNPSLVNVSELLTLIPQIQGQIPAAHSTKTGKKGSRNAALTALGVALGNEQTYLQGMQTRLRAAQSAKGTAMNGAWGGPAGTLSPTNTGNASGSYFDKDVNNSIRGIFKPESQEGGAKSGTAQRGAGAVREVGGYQVSQSLGLGVVPQTSLVAIDNPVFAGGAHQRVGESGEPTQVGSYQAGVQNVGGDVKKYLSDNTKAPRAFDADSLQKTAILDVLTLNADRHGENVMYRNDGTIAAIDQGEIAPTADRFVKKFGNQAVESGWAWADLPESEQAWSAANKQIIEDMDPEAEVDALAATIQNESTRMASVTGANPADTHLNAAQIAMMKYSGRMLKVAVAGGLTPAETETVFKNRGSSSRNADTKKTAKQAGGGEFTAFLSRTFFQDEQDAVIAKASNQPPPAPRFAYGDTATDEAFFVACTSGLMRVYNARTVPPVDIAATITKAMGAKAALKTLGILSTADPSTIPDTASGSETAARRGVRQYIALKTAGRWQEAYDTLKELRAQVTAMEVTGQLPGIDNLVAEMVEVSAHLDLPDPTIGAALPPITVHSTSAEAGRLWAHVDPPASPLVNIHVDDKVALATLWDGGPNQLRQRMIDVLDNGDARLKMSHTGYIMEALDVQHRMTTTSKLAEWYQAGHAGSFQTYLVNNPPNDPTNADYYDNAKRNAAQLSFRAGKVLQGAPAPAPVTTGAGEGWIVVLDPGGVFYSQPKSPRAQTNDKTQHSSFIGGIPVDAAAMWVIDNGVVKKINNYSGHYRPDVRHMVKFLNTLQARGVRIDSITIEDNAGLGKILGRPHFTGAEYLVEARKHLRP